VRSAALVAAVGVTAAFAVAPVGLAAKHKPPKPRTVKVGDDYFSPVAIKVPKGTTVVWKWLAYNGNTHDVKLRKGPKGVKHFHSDPAAADFTYKRKLTVKGKYTVICTFHEGMTMTVTVK
jgi:plastocyanin